MTVEMSYLTAAMKCFGYVLWKVACFKHLFWPWQHSFGCMTKKKSCFLITCFGAVKYCKKNCKPNTNGHKHLYSFNDSPASRNDLTLYLLLLYYQILSKVVSSFKFHIDWQDFKVQQKSCSMKKVWVVMKLRHIIYLENQSII